MQDCQDHVIMQTGRQIDKQRQRQRDLQGEASWQRDQQGETSRQTDRQAEIETKGPTGGEGERDRDKKIDRDRHII